MSICFGCLGLFCGQVSERCCAIARDGAGRDDRDSRGPVRVGLRAAPCAKHVGFVRGNPGSSPSQQAESEVRPARTADLGPPVEPARQSDHLTFVALPQFPGGMRSEFLHVDPFRDAEPLQGTSERSRAARSLEMVPVETIAIPGGPVRVGLRAAPWPRSTRSSTAGIPVPPPPAGRVGSPSCEDRSILTPPRSRATAASRASLGWPSSGRFVHISRDGNTLAKRAGPRQDTSFVAGPGAV